MNPIEIIFKGKDETKAAVTSVKSGLDGIQDSAKKTGNSFDVAMGVLAANQVQQFANAVSGFMTDSIREASEMQNAMVQIEQVLQSTGKASTITAEEIAKLADKFADASGFEDDMVASGLLILLQFQKISEEVLPRASQAMVDLATRMNMDIPAAARIVGKALEGEFGSLARFGIIIDENTKKQIEGLMEVGNVAGAQAIILGEFEKKFGGAAEASTKTWTGAMANLEKSVANLKGAFGEVILNSPAVSEAINHIAVAINWLADSFSKLPEGAKLGIAGIVGLVAVLGKALPALVSAKILLDGFGKGAAGTAGKVGFLTKVLTALKGLALPAAIVTWILSLDKISKKFAEWGKKVGETLGIELPAELQHLVDLAVEGGTFFNVELYKAEFDLIKGFFTDLFGHVSVGFPIMVQSASTAFNQLVQIVATAFNQLLQHVVVGFANMLLQASQSSQMLIQIIGIALTQLVNSVRVAWQNMTRATQEGFIRVLSSVRSWWANLKASFSRIASDARNWGLSIVQGIWAGIQSGWQWLLNMVRTNINSLLQWVKDLIGYGSPAKKLIPLGLSMAQGVGVGWEQGMKQFKPTMAAPELSYARAGVLSGGMGGATITGNTFQFYSPLTHDERRRIRKEQEEAAQRELLRSLR